MTPVSVVGFELTALQQLQALSGAKRPPTPKANKKEEEESKAMKVLGEGFRRLEGALGKLALGVSGTATGLAKRGFDGTADMARFNFALDRLAGQMAAVFQPVIQGLTYGANQLTRVMRSLNGNQQDRLLNTALGTGIGYAMGGPGGAIIGGIFGNQFNQRDIGPGGVALATGAGALGGFKIGGPVGAALGGGAAFFGASGIGDYYDALRGSGFSRAGAGFTAAGMAYTGTVENTARSLLDGIGVDVSNVRRIIPKQSDVIGDNLITGIINGTTAGNGRREAPLRFQPNEQEVGAAAAAIQQMVMLTTSGQSAADGGPYKDAIDTIINLLARIAGVEVTRTDPLTSDAARSR